MNNTRAVHNVMMLITVMLLCCIATTACGKTTDNAAPAVEQEAPKKTGAEEVSSKEWTAEGVYIDDNGNHLVLVYYSPDEGLGQSGWTVSAIFGEEMYGGFMDEDEGILKGDMIAYNSDGTEKERKAISLADTGDAIVMTTKAGEEYRFRPDDTDYSEINGDVMPLFQYNQLYAFSGFNPVLAGAYNYLAFDKAQGFDPGHAIIPYVCIVDMDESDPEDVLLYGDFYLWEFEKQEDTLKCVSSSHIPGVMHMKRTGDNEAAIYDAFAFDEGLTDADVVSLFGSYYDHYITLSSDKEMRDSEMAQIIADYVHANRLEVGKYQLYEGESGELPESKAGDIRERVDLPAYAYPDARTKEAAVYQYIVDTYYDRLSAYEYDTIIPYVVVISEDDSNSGDIKILLSGWVSTYNLEGDILEMQSGSEVSGAAYLKKSTGGYEVTDFEELGDGSEYDRTAKKIFGDHYNDFMNLDREAEEEVHRQIIQDYVSGNGLNIRGYKDMGADTVFLGKN
ncbi:MAG: hypothetical protein E7300_00385 [Lachnospiraceae bacterium]|jgi:hypothetical protein|nr:hypothetical protein [Lachnospiraceae bacterium]